MEEKNRTALTPKDICTLIAHETVSLLYADADALDTAAQLREGLASFASASGLTEETSGLLEWIDREMDSARQYSATGEDMEHLLEPEKLLAVPDAITLLYGAWMLFQASECLPQEKRQALLDTARTLFEMGGLEDLLMRMKTPAKNFLSAETLREELAEVDAAMGTMAVAQAGAASRGAASRKEAALFDRQWSLKFLQHPLLSASAVVIGIFVTTSFFSRRSGH